LELGDGTTIFESAAIARFIGRSNPDSGLGGAGIVEMSLID